MNELSNDFKQSISTISPLRLSPKVSHSCFQKEKTNNFPSSISSNSFVDNGSKIVSNKKTVQFKLSKKNQPYLSPSHRKLSHKSQESDNKFLTHPKLSSNLKSSQNNITIYNLEVFNVSPERIKNSSLKHNNSIFTNNGNVYNSIYISPQLTHKHVLDMDSTVYKKQQMNLKHSYITNNNNHNNFDDTIDSFHTKGMISNNCTNIQKTSKYGKRFRVSDNHALKPSYSFHSGKTPINENKLRYKNMKRSNLKSRKTNNNHYHYNINDVSDLTLNDHSRSFISINNKSNIHYGNKFNLGNCSLNNNNNISSIYHNSHLHLNSIGKMGSATDSCLDEEYEDYSGYDDDSPNKRSMKRLRLTNIFNPYRSHYFVPSELNAISRRSELDKSNIFLSPNRNVNSQCSSSTFLKTLNSSQYQHSKTNKFMKYSKKLDLSKLDLKPNISCGIMKGNTYISKQVCDLIEKAKNVSITNDNNTTTYTNMNNNNETFIIHSNDISFVKGFSALSYKNQTKINEDRFCISIHNKIPNSDTILHYFAIYDGHTGCKTAEYLTQQLHTTIINHPKLLLDPITSIKESIALIETHIIEDNINLQIESVEKSGSCVLVLLIIDEYIYIINIGDSRAIISVDSGIKVAKLTLDHKPNTPNEEKRILQCGGKIECSLRNEPGKAFQRVIYRTNPGFLSVSRSIGDVIIKLPHFYGRVLMQSAVPDVFVLKNEKEYDFIVLANDCIYDELNNNEIACEIYHIAKDVIESNGTFVDFLKNSITNLMKYAIEEGAQGNLSIILIVFDNLRKNIEKQNIDKINTAITRLENTLMDGDKLYSGIERKELYMFDKKELNNHPYMFYKPINDKSGNDTSLITFSHNNSTVGYNKKEYKNRSLASSLMSHLKQRICCGFFA